LKHVLRWLNLSLAVSAVGLLATTASGQGFFQNPPSGHNLLLKSGLPGGFCLDESEASGLANRIVYAFQCHGRPNQRWAIAQDEEVVYGAHAFSLVGADGKCLDVQDAKVGDHTPLQLFPCHLRPNQRFLITPTGNIVDRQAGKCVTAAGPSDRAPVFIDECRWNDPAQHWSFTPNL
jgi:hypothetical protein